MGSLDGKGYTAWWVVVVRGLGPCHRIGVLRTPYFVLRWGIS